MSPSHFFSFPKLDTIVIAPFCVAHPEVLYSRPMRQTLRDGALLAPFDDDTRIPAPYPTLVLEAAAAAGVKLKDLSFDLLASCFFELSLQVG